METYDLFKKSLRGHLSLPSHLSIQLILLSSYPLPRVTRKDLSTKVVKHSISAYHHENSHGDKKIQTYYKLKQQNASKCVKVVPICLATAICCTNTFPNYPKLSISKMPHINEQKFQILDRHQPPSRVCPSNLSPMREVCLQCRPGSLKVKSIKIHPNSSSWWLNQPI